MASIAQAQHRVGSSPITRLPREDGQTSHDERSCPLLALQDAIPKTRLRMEVATSHHAAPGSTLRDQAGRTTRERWAVRAIAAQERPDEAVAYAERCRSPWACDTDIDRLCEQILLASGQPEEAYARYAISANRAATYLGWFRAVA
jgi:hypothetical protein